MNGRWVQQVSRNWWVTGRRKQWRPLFFFLLFRGIINKFSTCLVSCLFTNPGFSFLVELRLSLFLFGGLCVPSHFRRLCVLATIPHFSVKTRWKFFLRGGVLTSTRCDVESMQITRMQLWTIIHQSQHWNRVTGSGHVTETNFASQPTISWKLTWTQHVRTKSSPQVNWQQVAPNCGWSTGPDDGAAAWRPTRTAHFFVWRIHLDFSFSEAIIPRLQRFCPLASSSYSSAFFVLPNFSPFTGRRVSDTKQAAASGHLLSIDESKENKWMRLFIRNILVCLISTLKKN